MISKKKKGVKAVKIKDCKYTIQDKRRHATFFYTEFSAYKKKVDQFKNDYPKEFKKRFVCKRVKIYGQENQ